MWRGQIAFSRRDRRHEDVSQVLLWKRGQREPQVLRHGAMPTRCPFTTGCAGSRNRGAVTGLDLGSRLVTFTWMIDHPGVVGHLGWEVRANDLRSGRSTRVGTGYVGEACTEGVDGMTPSTPSAAGTRVWWAELQSTCYRLESKLRHYDTAGPSAHTGDVPGVVLRLARADGKLYGLVAPAPSGEVAPATRPLRTRRARPCTRSSLDRRSRAHEPARETKIARRSHSVDSH